MKVGFETPAYGRLKIMQNDLALALVITAIHSCPGIDRAESDNGLI